MANVTVSLPERLWREDSGAVSIDGILIRDPFR